MKPTPSLSKNSARLRLTTKSINGGYYKGSRTGSMGAHTNYGGYLVDWRKVRTYNCPDLAGFELTPFVTRQMEMTRPITVAQRSPPSLRRPIDFVSDAAYRDYMENETRTQIDGLEMIRSFKADLPIRYSQLVKQDLEYAQEAMNPTEDRQEEGITTESTGLLGEQDAAIREISEQRESKP